MRNKNVILTGRMANAGRLITDEERKERDTMGKIEWAKKMVEKQQENGRKLKGMTFKEAIKSGLYDSRVYIVVEDETPIKEADKIEEERVMEDKVIISEEGRPVRLEVAENSKESLAERARKIKQDVIDNEINNFWLEVNENDAKVEAGLLNYVVAFPLKNNASFSFGIEIEKNGYEEFILASIDASKEGFKEHWAKDGVSADITTFNKDKHVKVVFTYNMAY